MDLDNKIKDTDEIVIDNQDELNIGGQEEGNIYPMSGLRVDRGFYSFYELKRKYNEKDKRIILDSDFQRQSVWNAERKDELIESVLMGLPLPIFYFNQDKYGKLIVIDGRQRLSAMFEYMNDEFPLKKLKVLPEENGKRFSQLSAFLQSRIEDYQVQAHVILPPTPDRLKFDIFDRVNRGGMQLNKQEIRNALYQGNATRLLNDIVKSEDFVNATGGAFKNEKRMKDKYLITRFWGLCMYKYNLLKGDSGDEYVYKGDIDDLLGKSMEYLNFLHNEEIIEIRDWLLNTLNKSYLYLGADAFRLMTNGKRTPINMNVFETIMLALSDKHLIYKDEIKPLLRNDIDSLINSNDFRDNIGNHRDSESKIKWRIEQAELIGRKYIA